MNDEKLDRLLKNALTPKICEEEIRIDENLEVRIMNAKINKRRGLLRIAAVLLAVLLLSTTAYAGQKFFGLLDFTKNTPEKIPESAKGLIQNMDSKVEYGKGNDLFDCKVREALCDSETIMVVLEVSAKQNGKYLFIPTDAMPKDDMADWSAKGGITAAEYAKKHGLTLVNIGGGILNREELGIGVESISFKSVSDDVLCVYVRCGKEQDSKQLGVECTAYAMILENEKIISEEKMDMKFALEDISSAKRSNYSAVLQGKDDVNFENVLRAKVIQTELHTYVDVYFDYQGEWRYAPYFRIKDFKGNVIESIGGSGIESEGDDFSYQRLTVNKTDFGKSFVIETLFDQNGKEIVGESFLMESE